MTAAGLGLNKYCYAGLITAFKNKTPASEETMAKVCYALKKIYRGVASNITVLKIFFALPDSRVRPAVERLAVC